MSMAEIRRLRARLNTLEAKVRASAAADVSDALGGTSTLSASVVDGDEFENLGEIFAEIDPDDEDAIEQLGLTESNSRVFEHGDVVDLLDVLRFAQANKKVVVTGFEGGEKGVIMTEALAKKIVRDNS